MKRNIKNYLALCAAVLGVLMGMAGAARAQTPVPLERDGTLYIVQQPAGGNATLSRLDRSTAVYTLRSPPVTSGAPPAALNGLGYNPVDGFMYLMSDDNTFRLYRIGKTGVGTIGYQLAGTISGLPNGNYFAGDVSKDGFLYLAALSNNNIIYRINLNNGAPYAAQAITLTVTSLNQGTAATTFATGDFVFGNNGRLYALSLNAQLLYEVAVSSGSNTASATQRITARNGVPNTATVGTLFYDGIQGPFAYDNAGGFYVVDVVNATVSSSSTATPVSRSDGTAVNDQPEFIDVVKSVGALNQVNARTFDVPFVVGVRNTSAATAQNIQVTDNLRQTFTQGNPAISISVSPRLAPNAAPTQSSKTPTFNANFNGTTDFRLLSGTDDYAPGETSYVTFTARLTYPTTAAVPTTSQRNFAYVSSVPGSTLTNNGHTYNAEGTAVRPNGAVASEASSPGTTFPPVKNGDEPGGTGVDLPPIALEGRVYDDFNFGGGAGRPFNATLGMAGVENARVEIYNAAGNFVGSTLSLADGTWSYAVSTTGTYYARVVNGSVPSSRTGTTPALIGVQTFRTNDGAAIPGEVGGRAPAVVDAGAGAVGTTLNVTNFTLSGTTTGQAQTVTPIVVANGNNRQGFDFGFNFDTIVNINNAGQGSLRQFVLNSNALGNAGLDQAANALFDPAAGIETSIFQIPNAALTGGIGRITLASGLTITGANAANTSIDGRTQTANVGDTNAGFLGTGGTVGVSAIALPTIPKPEIEINGPRTIAVGLDIAAATPIVRNVSMWGFGNAGDSDNQATIRLGNGAPGALLTQLTLGVSGESANNVPVNPANYGKGDLIRPIGATGGSITNSLMAYGGGKGVGLRSGANNWTIQANEIRDNARDNPNWDGVDAQVSGTQILENLVYNQGGNGLDNFNSTGTTVVRNNTVRNNGLGNTPTNGESPGIRLFGTNNSLTLNIINDNYGAGVLIQSNGRTLISRNSIFGNGDAASNVSTTPTGQIGIDLLTNNDAGGRGSAPFVTPNASGNKGAGGNGLLNFPVFTSQTVTGGNLIVEGFAPAGSTVEVFIAAPDPTGFGEGQTFSFTFAEGSAADTDATTGDYNSQSLQANGYPAATANLAGSETGANRFRVTVPAGGLTATSRLTATATVAAQTSEFSPVTVAFVAPSANQNTVNGTVYLDANRNSTLDNQESGTGLNNLFIKAVLAGANNATQAVAVNPSTGAFSFSGLAPGNYTLVLDDNATLTDITPAIPPGFVGTQSPNGTRTLTVSNQTILSQDFGLFSGAQITGVVYEDNGIGGGIANDGIRNGGEVGLAGVRISLQTNAGTIVDTATTDASGNFRFNVPNNVATGSLRIVETNLIDYVSTGATVGTTNGTYDRPSDTITFAYTAGATYSGISFGDVRGATLTGEDAKTGTIGSSVAYTHVFTAQTAGSVTFNVSQLPSPANPNWSVVAFRDTNNNGQLDGADAQLGTAPIAVAAGQSITVFLQNFIPTTATNGAQDRLTITANFAASGANAPPVQTLSRSDLTTVAANQGLVLTKTVDKATARSGDVLLYTITYRNTGADALTSLVVNDATPAYTTFVSAADGTRPAGLTGVTIAAPPVGGKGPVSWTFTGSLNPGQSGTVTFRVRVQ